MTTQIVKSPTVQVQPKASALRVMATRLQCDPDALLSTLKSTVFQKATNDEMLALVVVANAYDLNPFLKEIYAFPAKGGGIVPIISVDGWNKLLIRQDDFDGIEFEMTETDTGDLVSCTATVYTKSRSKPVRITEYFDECKRNTEPWNNMPRRMLRNRTLCQAARMAFGFAGAYNEDEAAPMIDIPNEPPPKLVRVIESKAGQDAPDTAKALPEATTKQITPQEELAQLVAGAGHDFNTFQKWGSESGNVKDSDSMADFNDVPSDVAKRLLRAKAGLLEGLTRIKGVAV